MNYWITILLTLLVLIANINPFLTFKFDSIERALPTTLGSLLSMLGLLYFYKHIQRHRGLFMVVLFYTIIKLINSILLAGIVNHSNIETATRFFIGDYFGDPLYAIIVLLEQVVLIISAYFYLTFKRTKIFKTVCLITLIQLCLAIWLDLNNILLFNSVVGLILYTIHQYDNIQNKFKTINFKNELLLLSFVLFFIQYFFETIYFQIELAADLSYSYIIIAILAYSILISTEKQLHNFFYNTYLLFILIPITLFLLILDKNPTFKIMYVILIFSYISIGFLIYKIKFKLR